MQMVSCPSEIVPLQGAAAPVGTKDMRRDLQNAHALGSALALCMAVPWALCGLFYTGEYVTFITPS